MMPAYGCAVALATQIAGRYAANYSAAKNMVPAGTTVSPGALCAAASAVLAATVATGSQPALTGAAIAVALSAACICAITDWHSGFIFDAVSIPATLVSLILAALSGNVTFAAAGVIAGGGALLLIFGVTKGGGLGLGDVKMACCIGSALGAAAVLRVVGLAFVSGGIYAAYLLCTSRGKRSDAIAFGPYLYAASLLVIVFPGIPWPV